MKNKSEITQEHPNGTPLMFFEKSIKAEVIFGMPSNRCKGTGICKVVAAVSNSSPLTNSNPCQATPATLKLEAQKRLSITFMKGDLCNEIISNQFRTGIFTVLETYALPKFVLDKLGYSYTCIEQGSYLVFETEEAYTIRF